MLFNSRTLNKKQMIEHLLYEIESRATRCKRASDLKAYLLRDLEAIASDTKKLAEVIAAKEKDYFL